MSSSRGARFEVGDDKVDAPAGTFVFVAPDERRTAFAEEADTTILAIGSVPGEPYQADGWELWAPAAPYYRSGDYEAAIDVLRPVAEANPQFPTLFYNLACLESLAGRPEDAIEHLGRAIALSERSRTAARDDSDFDPIREQPGFKRLVEVPS
jgi:tetratricopeptide (TPR) repeat protein